MSKESFKEIFVKVIENITKHPLSESGKTLTTHYFNESDKETSFLKAIDAIGKYYPEGMPDRDNVPKKLKKLLDEMEKEAEKWDNE